jgi:hypothetical protein
MAFKTCIQFNQEVDEVFTLFQKRFGYFFC